MQRFLDLTGDVQTVAWLGVRCLPPKVAAREAVVTEWIECYRGRKEGDIDSRNHHFLKKKLAFLKAFFKSKFTRDCCIFSQNYQLTRFICYIWSFAAVFLRTCQLTPNEKTY